MDIKPYLKCSHFHTIVLRMGQKWDHWCKNFWTQLNFTKSRTSLKISKWYCIYIHVCINLGIQNWAKLNLCYLTEKSSNFCPIYYTLNSVWWLTLKVDDFVFWQSGCYTLEGEDEAHEFARLKQSMEMVGFSSVTQKR